MGARLPVSIVTGFLGSGKTTLLRQVLADPAFADTLVVINELGEIGLDHLLVREVPGDIVLLDSGCLCCSVGNDLLATLREVAARRASGAAPRIARVIVETTGLADPAPIVHGLLADRVVARSYAVDSVVTTVDAMQGTQCLDAHREAVEQVALADRLVITKTDLAWPGTVEELRERLAAINPRAEAVLSAPGRRPAPALLFQSAQRRSIAAEFAAEWPTRPPAGGRRLFAGNSPRHDSGIATCSIILRGPIDWETFREWLELFLVNRASAVLRMKGLLEIAGRAGPVVIQGVRHVFHRPEELPGWPDEDHRSRLVFITRGLPGEAIEASLVRMLGQDAVVGPGHRHGLPGRIAPAPSRDQS